MGNLQDAHDSSTTARRWPLESENHTYLCIAKTAPHWRPLRCWPLLQKQEQRRWPNDRRLSQDAAGFTVDAAVAAAAAAALINQDLLSFGGVSGAAAALDGGNTSCKHTWWQSNGGRAEKGEGGLMM